MCALSDDPLPYFRSSDPRTLYGVDEPHSSYWSAIDAGGLVAQGCGQMSQDYMLDTSMCNLNSVETGMPPRIPPAYANNNNAAQQANRSSAYGARGGNSMAHMAAKNMRGGSMAHASRIMPQGNFRQVIRS
jgi:hypothetical protein